LSLILILYLLVFIELGEPSAAEAQAGLDYMDENGL